METASKVAFYAALSLGERYFPIPLVLIKVMTILLLYFAWTKLTQKIEKLTFLQHDLPIPGTPIILLSYRCMFILTRKEYLKHAFCRIFICSLISVIIRIVSDHACAM